MSDFLNEKLALGIIVTLLILPLGLGCQSEGNDAEFVKPNVDGHIEEGEYSSSKSFGPFWGLFGGYKIYWDNDESHLYIGIKVETEGWVAIGFQPQPGDKKKGVDFIIGYVESGHTYILDLFSEKAEGPHQFDEAFGGVNSILEYMGAEEDGFTTIEFKRALNTGDSADYIITPGNVYLLWSYSAGDSIYSEQPHQNHRGYNKIIISD